MRRGRRAWLRLHRWLGLGLGAAFALIGLTGSVIVFDHAIDTWLNPDLFTPQGVGPPRPLEEIVTAARATAPGPAGRLSITMPGVDYDVFVVRVAAGPAGRSVEVTLDPATARVLGQREDGAHLTAIIYELHHALLLRDAFGIPDSGMYAVGVLGLGLMASTLTGLYLWWPRRRQLGQALRVRWRNGEKRRNFDLHRAGGFWSSLVVLTLAFSGVSLVFPDWVRGLVAIASRTEPRPPAPRSVLRPGVPSLSPDDAAAIARVHVAGGTVTWLDVPGDETGAYRIWLRRPDDVRRAYGDVNVWIDRWSGAVLHRRDRRALPAGEAFLHWQFPLHSGEAFGLPGRLLICAAGLTPLLLLVTGALIWWRRRRRPIRGSG